MSVASASMRIGAAVLAAGLWWAGPQALGLAVAAPADPGTGERQASAAATPARASRTAERPARQRPAAGSRAVGKPGPAGARRPAPSAVGSDRDAVGVNAARRSVPVPAVTVWQPAPPTPPTTVPSVPEPVAEQPDPVMTAAIRPVRAAATAVAGLVVPAGQATTASLDDLFAGLLAPIQSFIEGIGLLVRRTFFNQVPSVAPVQLTGQISGPISGTLGATDPEGEPLSFRITQAPAYGDIDLAADGTYTYTPGKNFTGLDSFSVEVSDGGFRLNLLDLFRPSGTETSVQVVQNAVRPMLTFTFIYGSGSQLWSAQARAALQTAAAAVAGYLVVTSPVTIVYEVTAESSPLSSMLASAGSDLTSTEAGFFNTVVQKKILSGVDANGAEADGEITWNFGRAWAFGALVTGFHYDFQSTATHELLHTFGFLSNVDQPGNNTDNSWTTFDSFIVTSADDYVIDRTTFAWRNAYNANLTGGGGGLFFAGPNAVAVYGSPVPLYTPDPWRAGSSVSHLDDNTFSGAADKLMNATSSTGRGVRTLSPVERAILRDLGYTVTDDPVYAVVLIGLGLLRRRDRSARDGQRPRICSIRL